MAPLTIELLERRVGELSFLNGARVLNVEDAAACSRTANEHATCEAGARVLSPMPLG